MVDPVVAQLVKDVEVYNEQIRAGASFAAAVKAMQSAPRIYDARPVTKWRRMAEIVRAWGRALLK